MEDLVGLAIFSAAGLAMAVATMVADLAAVLLGFGWRYFSKRRAEARRLKNAEENG